VVKEKECTFFEVCLNPAVPGQIHWVEGWTEGAEWLMGVCIPLFLLKELLEGLMWVWGVGAIEERIL
jgi:hypothetical protein